nr:hypothetical protein [uncultured Marinifilum sp.]
MFVLKRIKGSSIIEVIIALLIGMLVLAMAMTIVVKTGKNYNANRKAKALLWMKNRTYQLELKPVVHEDTIRVNGMIIFESVVELEGKKDVLLLYMKAMTGENRFLAEKRRLINFKPDTDEETK